MNTKLQLFDETMAYVEHMRKKDRELLAAADNLESKTIMNLAERICKVRDDGDSALTTLYKQFGQDKADLKQHVHEEIKRLIAESGKRLCSKCDGWGTIRRLDAGYMRRFGLPEWDGCSDCGGMKEIKGRGFIE